MTDEEKKAINNLFYSITGVMFNVLYSQEEKDEDTKIALNLIGKQDKRIKELEKILIDDDYKHRQEVEKKDKIINRMAKFIEERLEECPYSFWTEVEEEFDCENCEEDYAKCWIEYFEKEGWEI